MSGITSQSDFIAVPCAATSANTERLRAVDFEQRSCLTKRRYKIEPSCLLSERAYPCDFCGGWHKATRKD